MKTKVLATVMALCTAFSMVGCKKKVANANKTIDSSCGGGYFYLVNNGTHYTLCVRNNSIYGNVDAYCWGIAQGEYGVEFGGCDYVIGIQNGSWYIA